MRKFLFAVLLISAVVSVQSADVSKSVKPDTVRIYNGYVIVPHPTAAAIPEDYYISIFDTVGGVKLEVQTFKKANPDNYYRVYKAQTKVIGWDEQKQQPAAQPQPAK
jgi:hypothetical protein